MLPGIESGQLARDDMVTVVAALRAWEADGTWGRHMDADGTPAWLVAWRERDRQSAISFGMSLSRLTALGPVAVRACPPD